MECAAVIKVVVDMTTCGFDKMTPVLPSVTLIISWSSSSSGVCGSAFRRSFSCDIPLTLETALISDMALWICGTGVFNSFSFPAGPGKGIP